MADDTAKIARSADEMAFVDHFCEFPGCVKWGGMGYDVGHGEAQWFCFEHKWDDYRLGKARRSFLEDEASGIEAIMVESRTIPGMGGRDWQKIAKAQGREPYPRKSRTCSG